MKFINLINNKKFNKKYLFVFIFLLLALLSTFNFNNYVYANSSSEIEKNLGLKITEIIGDLDVEDIESLLNQINTLDLFKGSLKDKLISLIKGEYFTDYSSIIGGILSVVFVDIKNILPFLFTIIVLGIMGNLIVNFKSDNKNIPDIISLIFMSVMIITLLVGFKNTLKITNTTFKNILSQMQIIFPMLITFLVSIGSISTVSILNPIVLVLTNIITFVFEKLLYPMFITIFLFTILNSLTNTIKLDKLNNFIMSLFKWIIGIVFTLFTGFLAIQGISAGKFDSISIKATKFTMKSYIPIIGSYISEGMDFFILGSVLVKNAIGLVGVAILFFTILSPIISILIFKLSLQFCGGIVEMCGNSKIGNFLHSASKLLILPIVLILGISLMYMITISLIICTANIL